MQHELCIWTENTLEINSRNVLGVMSWSASLWTACLEFASLATKAQVTGTVFPENGNMFPESSRDLKSLPSFISNWAPAVKWTVVVEREKKSVFQLSSCVPCVKTLQLQSDRQSKLEIQLAFHVLCYTKLEQSVDCWEICLLTKFMDPNHWWAVAAHGWKGAYCPKNAWGKVTHTGSSGFPTTWYFLLFHMVSTHLTIMTHSHISVMVLHFVPPKKLY